ncbi:MAG: arginine--tRNA ligase, partial [Gammaproteobacteria bacterium]|nr:arginine--tRNA ligase [Gammaproteobacteria bacterium]
LFFDQKLGLLNLALLTEEHETELLQQLAKYPEVLNTAASQHEPHLMAHYLRDLANALHTYYNAHQFIVDDNKIRNARLVLIVSTRQVIKNGLALLGVSSPDEM